MYVCVWSALLSKERLFLYIQKCAGFSLTLDLFVQLTVHNVVERRMCEM